MPTPEEIKKIARQYAEEYHKDILRFCTDSIPNSVEVLIQRKQEEIIKALEWLSKDYCIVSKSKVKEVYDCYKQHEQVTDKKGLHDAMLIARGSIATMHEFFGTKLFNEEKG